NGDVRQPRRLGFEAAGGGIEVEGEAQATRRRRGGAGRQGEGEQLQQVECGNGAQAEPAQGGGDMHHERRRQGAQPRGGLGGGKNKKLPVGRQDRGAPVPGDHGGRVGQEQ